MRKGVGTRRQVGRPRLLTEEDERFLLARAATNPHVTTRELAVEISARKGRQVRWSTIATVMKRLGVHKVKPLVAPKVPLAKRAGYTQAHRRNPDGAYASSVTDVEWALIGELFELDGAGRPPRYPRRAMFDAISYVVRSGCAWRMLPKDFPPWASVYMTFRRWSEQGLFETMHDRLRTLWREREARADSPTAAIIDSQSVKTAEKGGSTVSTPARRSRVASVTS